MNENTPPENDSPEPSTEPATQTFTPQQPATAESADSPPSWAFDKFKRNTVVGGAAIAGAVIALVGASLADSGNDRGDRVDFRGPPGMQGQGMQGPGMQGPGGPGQMDSQQGGPQGQRGDDQFQGPDQDQPKQSDQSDSK